MAKVRDIVQFPTASVLRKKATEVCAKDSSEEVKRIVEELKATCLAYDHCVGLAANQIAYTKRVIVVRPDTEKQAVLVLINPVAEPLSDAVLESDVEGCMSIKELQASVKRFNKIKVNYLDESLTPQELVINDDPFFARVILHEIDHLDGRLFIDRLSPIQKLRANKLLKKILKGSS
ncbi:MAG: peptide deformylase [Candidatus Comchoanobacterales bacterium]